MPRHALFDTDAQGRTTLFDAAARGDLDAVQAIVFQLAGTGIACERLALITHEDRQGLTAVDLAKRAGHNAIVLFLRGEEMRMTFFE